MGRGWTGDIGGCKGSRVNRAGLSLVVRAGCSPPQLALGQFLVHPEVKQKATVSSSQAEGKPLGPLALPHPGIPVPLHPGTPKPSSPLTLAL